MTALERKAAMVLKGVSQTDIARALEVTPQHVSAVVNGERRSPRVEQAIADAIGKPLEEVFEAEAAQTD